MAWSANITNVYKQNGKLQVVVRYTDGVRLFDKTYERTNKPDDYWIKKVIKTQLNALEEIDTISIKTGIVELPIEIPPPSVDPVIIELRELEENIDKFQRIIPLIDMGILTANDSKVVALKTDIADKLTTYWDNI